MVKSPRRNCPLCGQPCHGKVCMDCYKKEKYSKLSMSYTKRKRKTA